MKKYNEEFEVLNGRLINRLRLDIDLLHEALHALTRDPPKTNVTIEHLDQVIDNLTRELYRLRTER